MAQNFDRRRINGPEDSLPPVYDDDDGDDLPYAKWASGHPRIGRAAEDIRPICAYLHPNLYFDTL
jgi:exosome complex component MTR3